MALGFVFWLSVVLQVSQNYPSKPVRMIEPFGAGGGPDLIARAIGPKLSELWGQPVTVENHPGAGSTAAPALVAKSPPGGYTLLVNTSAQAYSAAFLKNLPYDPLKDFTPVAPLTSQPYVLVTGSSSGITNLGELIAAAKARPGQLKFASTGVGTGTHIGLEKFNLEAGIKAVHTPAKAGEAIADVIANTVAGGATYMMAPIQLALADIQAGKLRALGVTTNSRSHLLPEVPTIAEGGVTGFRLSDLVWSMGACWHSSRCGRQVSEGHRAGLGCARTARLVGRAWGRADEHDTTWVRTLRYDGERKRKADLQCSRVETSISNGYSSRMPGNSEEIFQTIPILTQVTGHLPLSRSPTAGIVVEKANFSVPTTRMEISKETVRPVDD
jgi:tripartite-type tricarboxylate transporter receptor subunit TctC